MIAHPLFSNPKRLSEPISMRRHILNVSRAKFGVAPTLMTDYLALVGDAADGYPGIAGIGAVTAAQLLNRHGAIENFPPALLGARRTLALLFKKLATLRTDAPLFRSVDALRWNGPTDAFASFAARIDTPRLVERAAKARVALTENAARIESRSM